MQGSYTVLTSFVMLIAGILGAITTGDLFRVIATSDADSSSSGSGSLPQDLIDKVNPLKDALVALVVS